MKKYFSILMAATMITTAAGCSATGKVNGASSDPSADEYSSVAAVNDHDVIADKSTVAAEGGATFKAGADELGDAELEHEYSFADDAVADVVMDGAACEEPSFAGAGEEMEPCEPVVEEDYQIKPQAGLLTGGEWRDNDHWNDWVSLYQSHDEWNDYRELWQVSFENRYEVIVTADGEPVEGAKVTASCGYIKEAVTDNKGRAYLFFDDCSTDEVHEIKAEYGDVSKSEAVDMESSAKIEIDLGQSEMDGQPALELMLMIDTTGSMGDELGYIQAELEDVIERVKSDNGNIPIKLSVNFYRDEYDDYIVRDFPFTEDISSAIADLAAQRYDGGGDYPEAVHTALTNAVKEHEWSEDSTKLMFLILDAPPHDDDQIIDEVNARIADAAARGIRVIPVASSGVDKATEYLLRTMAFATGGTYTFLTDHSGIGGSHIEPTIGDYQVEKLNDMMVRIINSYLE